MWKVLITFGTRLLKKRLDKVRIKGTEERLTEPGKISSSRIQRKEIPEYLEYIEFLKIKHTKAGCRIP